MKNYEQGIRIYLIGGTRIDRKMIQFYSFSKHAWRIGLLDGIRRRWKLEANGNLHTRRLTRLPHLSLSSTLCVVTHSFCVTRIYERVHRHHFYCSADSHTRIARAMHAHTDARNHKLKVPPPTAAHPIASRFLSRAVPSLHPHSQILALSPLLSPSLGFSLLTCR